MRLLVPLLLTTATLAAAEEVGGVSLAETDGELFGFSRAVVTLLALGIALILLALLFMLRRFIGTIMNVTFLMLGALLVIVALFGHQIGVYDAIDMLISADPVTP